MDIKTPWHLLSCSSPITGLFICYSLFENYELFLLNTCKESLTSFFLSYEVKCKMPSCLGSVHGLETFE